MIFSRRSVYLNSQNLNIVEMSEISTGNDDNRSVAASDFVQLNQPDEMPDQEEQEQFEFQQNPLDWTDSESTSTNNNGNDLKEMKLMIANLEVFLQGIINYLVFWGKMHR
jgi:hypothetical protein